MLVCNFISFCEPTTMIRTSTVQTGPRPKDPGLGSPSLVTYDPVGRLVGATME